MDDVLPLLPPSNRNHLLRLRRQVSVDWDGAAILQYCFASGILLPWCWPLDEKFERVLPRNLDSHYVDNPYCLCGKSNNVESRILRATTGNFVGEWVAECATGRCGYFVPLERYYSRRNMMTKRYPRGDSTLLMLDAAKNPGLTEDQFKDLFVACPCGVITTRRVFHLHKCSEEIIDLTGDSDDDSE